MTRPISFVSNAATLLQQALQLHQQGQLVKAAQLYERVLASEPRNAQALYLLGTVALQNRQFDRATELLTRAATLNARHVPTLINLGMALSQQGRYDEALSQVDHALRLEPTSAAARGARVGILIKLERYQHALSAVEVLMQGGHHSPELWVNKGIALTAMGEHAEADESFNAAIKLAPRFALAHHYRILSLIERDDPAGALSLADDFVAMSPNDADAHADRGHALLELRRYEDAADAFERACALEVTEGRLAQMATSLALCGQTQKAIAAVEQGFRLFPDSPSLWSAAAQVHAAEGQYGLAVEEFDRYLEVKGDVSGVLVLKATALMQMKRYDEGKQALLRCDERDRNRHLALSMHAKLMAADWSELDQQFEQLTWQVESDDHEYNPFATLGLLGSARLQQRVASAYMARHQLIGRSTDLMVPEPARKLRVGYFSADFHQHATSQLMVEVLESHDRDRFEWVGFSYGGVEHDVMADRVAAAFDDFKYVKAWSDQDIVAEARRCQLDIAVDLKGFTQDSRLRPLHAGCAPIQVSYLGYPGTLGADFIDYIIADETIVPPEHEPYFSEKIVRMPHSYQCNDSDREISPRSPARAELGLPEDAFVFCCFNNNYKILPDIFARWMRVLQATPDSVLWLYEGNDACATNLRSHAEAAGVSDSRLVFAPPVPLAEHLARLKAADLFLDTLPCNAHTTASDALWAGLPLLTCLGDVFQGRVAASLLRALSMDELVTHDLDEYEAEAIALAREPLRLAGIRQKLAANRLSSSLFDGRRFARNLEKAFEAMVRRHRAGLPPESFTVEEDGAAMA